MHWQIIYHLPVVCGRYLWLIMPWCCLPHPLRDDQLQSETHVWNSQLRNTQEKRTSTRRLKNKIRGTLSSPQQSSSDGSNDRPGRIARRRSGTCSQHVLVNKHKKPMRSMIAVSKQRFVYLTKMRQIRYLVSPTSAARRSPRSPSPVRDFHPLSQFQHFVEHL